MPPIGGTLGKGDGNNCLRLSRRAAGERLTRRSRRCYTSELPRGALSASSDAGAHVLCEKPFVSTIAEADHVIDAADRAGRKVAVNHEYREMPIYRTLHDHIGTDGVGRLVFCQIWQLMDVAPWDEPVPWRAAMPNRTLFEGGVHLVDLLMNLYGERPTGVYARHTSGLDPSREADAIHLITLDFPDGRLAQITIDRLCKGGMRYVEVRADWEQASLRASHGGRALIQIGKKRAERGDFGSISRQADSPGWNAGSADVASLAARATPECTRHALSRSRRSRRLPTIANPRPAPVRHGRCCG